MILEMRTDLTALRIEHGAGRKEIMDMLRRLSASGGLPVDTHLLLQALRRQWPHLEEVRRLDRQQQPVPLHSGHFSDREEKQQRKKKIRRAWRKCLLMVSKESKRGCSTCRCFKDRTGAAELRTWVISTPEEALSIMLKMWNLRREKDQAQGMGMPFLFS